MKKHILKKVILSYNNIKYDKKKIKNTNYVCVFYFFLYRIFNKKF